MSTPPRSGAWPLTEALLVSRLRLPLALLAAVWAGAPSPARAVEEPVTFSATGDYPYGSSEIADLQRHMDEHNLYSPSDFFVHVGDINAGSESCREERYGIVADELRRLAVPAFITPGDNEWVCCSDPDQAWEWWWSQFAYFDQNFCMDFEVEHQAVRPENWAFVHKGVLFVCVNIPAGSGGDQSQRLQDDADWVDFQFTDKGAQVRAAVVFGHAGPKSSRDTFFDQFRASSAALDKPVLYVNGDTHSWVYEQPWPESNMWRIVVQKGGSEDPVQITVDMDPVNPFSFIRDPWSGSSIYNREPCVDAGDDQTVDVSQTLFLDAGVVDDGVPTNPGTVTHEWSKASGPGNANFVTPTAASTDVTFSSPGLYAIVHSAFDGEKTGTDTVAVEVTGAGQQYVLTLETTGSGTVDVQPPGGTYFEGTVLTLEAQPDPGWLFDTWGGALDGTTTPTTLTMDSNKTVTATFTPIPAAPEITVTPVSHEYGPVVVEATSTHTFQVRNDGSANLEVSSISLVTPLFGDFAITDGGGSVTLTTGQTHDVVVAFAPTFLGAHEATLRISSNDADEATTDVTLTGTGVAAPAPDIAVSPTSHDFGEVYETQQAPTVLTIYNQGDAPLNVSSVSVEGFDAAEFIALSPFSLPPVAAGDSTAFNVLFAPSSPGAKTAALRIESDDPDESPALVPLSGTGVALPAGGTQVTLEEIRTGTSASSISVTSAPLEASVEQLFLAAVSNKKRKPVTEVSGAGLTWTLIEEQCSGRGQTMVSLWQAFGTTSGGAVTATFTDVPSNAAIAVTRYSGASAVNPIGQVKSGNTNGVDGICTGGVDSAAYSLEVSAAIPGSLLYGAAAMRDHAHEPGPGFTERIDLLAGSGGSAASIAIQDQPVTTPGTFAVSGTLDSSTDWAAAALVLLPGVVPDSPEIVVTPLAHDYGALVVDAGSASQSFEVRNEGTADLHVSSIALVAAGDFAVTAGGGAVTLAPGQGRFVDVQFTPTALGQHAATLRVQSDDADEPTVDVVLTGSGVPTPAPEITVTPTSHDFGSLLAGADSASQPIEIRNDGTADLHVSSIALVDVIGNLSVTSGGAAVTIAPGLTQIVEVAFVPVAPGPASATLRVQSDDADEAVSDVAIAGTGIAPEITVTPTSHDYGAVVVGSGGASQSFEVHNEGTANLQLTSISLVNVAGDFAITTPTDPVALAPGEIDTIAVHFDPSTLGAHGATLCVQSDDSDEPMFDVFLTGTGVVPEITVTPAAHEFGALVVSSDSSSQAFEIRNDGTSSLHVSSIGLAHLLGEFSITSGADTLTLAPGGGHTVVVLFAPTTLGAHTATLRIESDDPDESTTNVDLTGSGVAVPAPEITVTPLAHDFGSLVVNEESAFRDFEIRNDGSLDLNVTAISIVNVLGDLAITGGETPVLLAPGESHTVTVAFAPTIVGPHAATLRIESDDADESAVDVTLSGTGVTAPTPDVTLSPGSHDFGDVIEGATATTTFTIGNAGDATLEVSTTFTEGSDAAEFTVPNVALSLAPGDSTTLDVTFTPASPGAKSASLRIESNDPDESPLLAPLAGVGVEPPPSTDVVFEEVQIGASSSSLTVSSNPIGGGVDQFYLAAISNKKRRSVTGVTGAGLAWTLVKEQCSGRGQTMISVWRAFGSSAGGAVTATFAATPSNAAIAVTRYTGASPVDPIGDLASGNSHGLDGACSGGMDSGSWAFDVDVTTVGSLVYGAAGMRNHTQEPGAGFSERADFQVGSGGSGASVAVQDRLAAATGTVTVSGTLDSSTDWAALALVVLPGVVADAPDVTVTPPSHDFGALVAGVGSGVQKFDVSNGGTADLHVSSISLVNVAGDFTITNGGNGVTLVPGSSHSVEVRFAPASLGAHAATLRIASDDPDEGTFDVSVTGTGAPPPAPEITITPSSHDYGPIVVSSGGAQQTFRIRNDGDADLHVSSISLVAPLGEFLITQGAGTPTLAPGQTHDVQVAFDPTALGPQASTLRIVSDDADETTSDVALAGTGVTAPTPDIAVSPAAHDFGDVFEGFSASTSFFVHNHGTATLNVTATFLEGVDAGEFTIDGAPNAIAPGDSATIDVSFAPLSIGAKSATLRIESDDADENPVLVPLSGTGVEVPPGGTEVVFEELQSGSSESSASVTSSAIGGGADQLYLAAVSNKKHKPVTSVTGAGLTWTLVREQCSGRNQTMVSLWSAFGTTTGGAVTATFTDVPNSAVIAVTRYSGASAAVPIGEVVSGNSNGVDGACSGGVDSGAYSFDVTATSIGSLVYGAAALRSHTRTVGAGFVDRAHLQAGSGGSAASIAVQEQSVAAPGTYSVDGILDSVTDWAAVAIVILPGGTGGLPGAATVGAEVQTLGEASTPEDPTQLSSSRSATNLPNAVSLQPGYPNPFRSETSIDFALPVAGRVVLVVHDTRGRVVRRLVDRSLPAGYQRASWDGRDGTGRRVAAGVYFVRLTTGTRSMVRKIVLLK